MSIASNSLITWADFSTTCLAAIKNVCCNIGSIASNVPARLRSGQGAVTVYTQVRSRPSGATGGDIQNSVYQVYNPTNLISAVTEATVNAEWNTFLSAAGIDTRSNKIIQAQDFTLAVALYMQFMSFHIKPVYSRLQAYNTLDGSLTNPFEGCKYITGTCTPDYTLTAINPGNIPVVDNSDITNIINKNFQKSRLLTRYNNPLPNMCSLG